VALVPGKVTEKKRALVRVILRLTGTYQVASLRCRRTTRAVDEKKIGGLLGICLSSAKRGRGIGLMNNLRATNCKTAAWTRWKQ